MADLTSSAIAVSSGSFDASQVTFSLPSATGTLDYNLNAGDGTPFIRGTADIGGFSGLNGASGGVVTTFGAYPVVEIPINLDVYVSSQGLDLVFQGQILGVALPPMMPVPEPTGIILCLSAVVGFFLFRKRRASA